MKNTEHRQDNDKDNNVEGTKVKIAEVNADDPVPIVPGEGNRNFDDPVIPNDDSNSKK